MAFDPLEDGVQPQNGYQFVQCHMIFDVKMEDFCWKVWLVAGEHMTDVPPKVTYASVVLPEMVRIALTMAALNALKVMVANIMNAYILPPTRKRYGCYLVPNSARIKNVRP